MSKVYGKGYAMGQQNKLVACLIAGAVGIVGTIIGSIIFKKVVK